MGFFLREKGDAEKIQFVPVQIGRICACLFMGVLLFQATMYAVVFGGREWDAMQATGIMAPALLLQTIVILPVLQYTMTAMLKDLSQLPRQVSEFRVQDSECTCCTQKHCHPVTHAPIACDRELIYKSLRRTFGPSGRKMDEEAALDAFNGHVRETLARSIDRSFRHHSMVLRQGLVTCAIACAPWASLNMAIAGELSAAAEIDMFSWFGGFIYIHAALFCLMRIALLIGHFGAFRTGKCPQPAVVLSQVVMFSFSAMAILLPWPVTWVLSDSGRPWIWISVFIAMLCISGCFLWPACSGPSGTPVLQPDLPGTTYGSETLSARDEDEGSTFEI